MQLKDIGIGNLGWSLVEDTYRDLKGSKTKRVTKRKPRDYNRDIATDTELEALDCGCSVCHNRNNRKEA